MERPLPSNAPYAPLGNGELKEHQHPKKGEKNYNALLLLASVAMFVCYALVSALAPFFPLYAEEKFGSSSFMVGVAIAANPALSVIFSPVAGTMCSAIGRGPVLLMGSVAISVGTTLFGVSQSMACCLVARMVQGIGAAMMIVAATALLIGGAPDLARALAIEELFVGVGYILGPALGGILYDTGGFQWTFVILSTLPALFALFVPWGLRAAGQPLFERCSPNMLCQARRPRGEQPPGPSSWATLKKMLRNRVVVVCCATTLLGATALGFLDPTLAGHVELTMETSARVTGVVFTMPAILYAAGVKFAPGLVERYGYKLVTTAGFLLEAISFFLLGPAPIFHGLIGTRWASGFATCSSLLLLGLGVALMFIPALPAMKESLFIPGTTTWEKERLTDAISSAFNFANSAGEVLGPVLGALFVQYLPRYREVSCEGSAERCESGFVSATLLYAVVLSACGGASYVFIPHGGRRRKAKRAAKPAFVWGCSGTVAAGAGLKEQNCDGDSEELMIVVIDDSSKSVSTAASNGDYIALSDDEEEPYEEMQTGGAG